MVEGPLTKVLLYIIWMPDQKQIVLVCCYIHLYVSDDSNIGMGLLTVLIKYSLIIHT